MPERPPDLSRVRASACSSSSWEQETHHFELALCQPFLLHCCQCRMAGGDCIWVNPTGWYAMNASDERTWPPNFLFRRTGDSVFYVRAAASWGRKLIGGVGAPDGGRLLNEGKCAESRSWVEVIGWSSGSRSCRRAQQEPLVSFCVLWGREDRWDQSEAYGAPAAASGRKKLCMNSTVQGDTSQINTAGMISETT